MTGLWVAAGWADPPDRQQILGSRASGFFAGEYMKELDTLYKSTENLPIRSRSPTTGAT
jgi:hypothetical protein